MGELKVGLEHYFLHVSGYFNFSQSYKGEKVRFNTFRKLEGGWTTGGTPLYEAPFVLLFPRKNSHACHCLS